MILRTDGRSFAVSQSAPDFLVLSEAQQIPPGYAELTVTIDGATTKLRFEIVQAVSGRRVEVGAIDTTRLAAEVSDQVGFSFSVDA